MKNSIILFIIVLLTLQFGYTTNPITTNNSEINNDSYALDKSSNQGIIDNLTASIKATIKKGKSLIKKNCSFCKKEF